MFRIFIAYLWLIHIVATTVGLPVHRIYCACTGRVELAFTSAHHCDAESAETPTCSIIETGACCQPAPTGMPPVAACCATMPVSQPKSAVCCSAPIATSAASLCTNTDTGCMDDQVVYIHLDTDLHIVKTAAHALYAPLADLLISHTFYAPRTTVAAVHTTSPAAWHAPPMRPYGRFLLPFVQTWLC